MSALRTGVSALGLWIRIAAMTAGGHAAAIRLIAQFPTWSRLPSRATGRRSIAPRPDLGHAANFLYMLSGADRIRMTLASWTSA